MRSILVGEVRTGRRITQIPVSGASWSVEHRGPGSISVDIPLAAADFAALERQFVGGLYPGDAIWPSPETYPVSASPVWRPGDGLRPELLAALEPVRCFLAVVEGDTVLEAGPIWTWDFDYSTSVLTVTAKGLWSLFDHRLVIGDIASAWAEWAVTYSNLSLATIAKRVVQLTEAHSGGELPIVLPADEASTHERTYFGYDMATVRQRIEDLMGVEGGPDIAFRPRLTEDRQGIEWVMLAGTAAQPMLSQVGDDWQFDAVAPRGSIGGLSVSRDASRQANRSYVTGSGMETALLVSRREPANIGATDLRDVGFPLLENVEARSTVELTATLRSWADANLRSALRPWQSWRLEVRADGSPPLGAYWPGDWARVWVDRSHPLLGLLLPQGYHRARVLSISGDLGDTVSVSMAPSMEVR